LKFHGVGREIEKRLMSGLGPSEPNAGKHDFNDDADGLFRGKANLVSMWLSSQELLLT
jgi:hypothetical protein